MIPLLSGLLSGGANLLGSIFSSNTSASNTAATNAQSAANTAATNAQSLTNQQDAEAFDQQSVAQQENYETSMSNTAYQRAQADMKAAGLNPILAAGASESTPSVAAPTISAAPVQTARVENPGNTSPFKDLGPSVQAAISSANQIKVQDATIDNLVADAGRANADARLKGVEAGTSAEQAGLLRSETDKNKAILPTVLNDALRSSNQMDMNPTLRKFMDQAGYGGRQLSEALSPVSNMVSSARQIGLMTGKGY